MDIGRIQRRFTAEPVDPPVPATPEAPVEALVETLVQPEQAPATVTADARP
ncbi:hypothetical protein [Actinomycetospora termitidis]|uniref:Uncharacterized protein n=1 Tax=Actinomycetospora termitidis TaxID=3053470 RepID=A0ABT7MG04_9PSEU|nr:hypothetical protein [Actinomycetospora sp. Odt1-22]MDL5159601.1 hypothetical protein [Actinomycetospora sp. Odt1-22]